MYAEAAPGTEHVAVNVRNTLLHQLELNHLLHGGFTRERLGVPKPNAATPRRRAEYTSNCGLPHTGLPYFLGLEVGGVGRPRRVRRARGRRKRTSLCARRVSMASQVLMIMSNGMKLRRQRGREGCIDGPSHRDV
jgi:hypothetical protein